MATGYAMHIVLHWEDNCTYPGEAKTKTIYKIQWRADVPVRTKRVI